MTKRLETKRFHVDTGPAELFERVLQIFEEPRQVKLHAGHFRQRAAERTAPKWALDPFDGADWSIVTAEVRTDSGKFVHTQWRRVDSERAKCRRCTQIAATAVRGGVAGPSPPSGGKGMKDRKPVDR